ncbi:GTP 3',8-cyclase MoaA [Undibacterium sp. CY18W]|uniref:GTP 3',8-cyclase n=1 Tax=Undibacterium hunanense TaxID=2762292 RepID=A0ABR6ZK93_9BURK|nr:GTP 3',8-cyclase MoaA [Undibacterium hunanense]MBC3916297.1 GTP 3',8-cyclase MoaA [Undibacterium hunanense]
MTEKFIPLTDFRQFASSLAIPDQLQAPDGQLQDTLARPLHDLRISVTDRCNFRCVYCMPKAVFDKDYQYLPHQDLLSFEEIHRLASIFVAHGVNKIRLTGGEPLLRKNIEKLIALLAGLRTPDGKQLDLTLTTNGSLLARKAQSLKDAGLTRVSVSLDALNDNVFRHMNDVDFSVSEVLEGIAVAEKVGLGPVKVNMVVKAGVNDQEIVPMARYFQRNGQILRFIEYMDVGASNGWQMEEVIPSAEIIRRIQAAGMPLTPIEANYKSETAKRWRHTDGGAELGLISSVTQAFCSDCTRARLSTEGKLYTCLFATRGHDLRALLRASDQHSDLAITNVIAGIWRKRDDRYSELRSQQTGADSGTGKETGSTTRKKIEMSYIGG